MSGLAELAEDLGMAVLDRDHFSRRAGRVEQRAEPGRLGAGIGAAGDVEDEEAAGIGRARLDDRRNAGLEGRMARSDRGTFSVGPLEINTARSITFCSSRMFPGQE